ncbi:MAG: hypothetical protein M3T49_01900 [Candidatus Eremiobacteraeota bacterium]|nr:hypothetical protein [Candidatus Eremiobacteraeota bacterium]
MQHTGLAHGFFDTLARHGYERVGAATAQNGLVEVTLELYPPAFSVTVKPAHGYNWIPPRRRTVNPLRTRPAAAAELAMSLADDLLADIGTVQESRRATGWRKRSVAS